MNCTCISEVNCTCINVTHTHGHCNNEAKYKCPECGAKLCGGCVKRHHVHMFNPKENKLDE